MTLLNLLLQVTLVLGESYIYICWCMRETKQDTYILVVEFRFDTAKVRRFDTAHLGEVIASLNGQADGPWSHLVHKENQLPILCYSPTPKATFMMHKSFLFLSNALMLPWKIEQVLRNMRTCKLHKSMVDFFLFKTCKFQMAYWSLDESKKQC
jgi:hypothetical protein